VTRQRDEIDLLLEAWARRRREVVGIRHPLKASEYLGPLKCTLGQRRDLHAGATTNFADQAWPEFPYTGDLALVNEAVKRSPPTLREFFDWHWTLETPRDKRKRADLMGLSTRTYWERVKFCKVYVSGALAIVESVRTLSPVGSATTCRV
jgi:hypothetical protein